MNIYRLKTPRPPRGVQDWVNDAGPPHSVERIRPPPPTLVVKLMPGANAICLFVQCARNAPAFRWSSHTHTHTHRRLVRKTNFKQFDSGQKDIGDLLLQATHSLFFNKENVAVCACERAALLIFCSPLWRATRLIGGLHWVYSGEPKCVCICTNPGIATRIAKSHKSNSATE